MHPFFYHYYLQTSGTFDRVCKLLNEGVPNLYVINGIAHCNNGMAVYRNRDNDEGSFDQVHILVMRSLNGQIECHWNDILCIPICALVKLFVFLGSGHGYLSL